MARHVFAGSIVTSFILAGVPQTSLSQQPQGESLSAQLIGEWTAVSIVKDGKKSFPGERTTEFTFKLTKTEWVMREHQSETPKQTGSVAS
jgi:hypothetical protein